MGGGGGGGDAMRKNGCVYIHFLGMANLTMVVNSNEV